MTWICISRWDVIKLSCCQYVKSTATGTNAEDSERVVKYECSVLPNKIQKEYNPPYLYENKQKKVISIIKELGE